MKIVYPTETGIAIVCPAGELSIEEVARKDVPAGTPYKFVEDEAFPEDRIFRNAWDVDFSTPDGYGIGQEAWFEEKRQKEKEAVLEVSGNDSEEDEVLV